MWTSYSHFHLTNTQHVFVITLAFNFFIVHYRGKQQKMGQRDAKGKRVKWTRAEKKMVREMKEAGLRPAAPVLTLRSKAERLGKVPVNPTKKSPTMPPHLSLRRTPKIRSVIVVPDAAGAGPSDLRVLKSEPKTQKSAKVQEEVQFAAHVDDDDVMDDVNAEVPKCADEGEGEDMSFDDDASYIHDEALVKYVPDDEIYADSFITDQWEGWMPEFYPLYEGPTLPLADLPMDIIFAVKDNLPRKDQVKFLTAVGPIARRPEVKRVLFQIKRVQRQLFRLMGEWNYYLRWVQPKELARGIADRDERIACAYRHYCKYGKNTRFEQMSINDIAHLWGVFGTELREEIDWQEGGDTDSSDDDIMQQ